MVGEWEAEEEEAAIETDDGQKEEDEKEVELKEEEKKKRRMLSGDCSTKPYFSTSLGVYILGSHLNASKLY